MNNTNFVGVDSHVSQWWVDWHHFFYTRNKSTLVWLGTIHIKPHPIYLSDSNELHTLVSVVQGVCSCWQCCAFWEFLCLLFRICNFLYLSFFWGLIDNFLTSRKYARFEVPHTPVERGNTYQQGNRLWLWPELSPSVNAHPHTCVNDFLWAYLTL